MAMDAGWDEELLRVEIESLQAADDPLLTGFDESAGTVEAFDDGIEAKEDDFDVDAELQKPTFFKTGRCMDTWQTQTHLRATVTRGKPTPPLWTTAKQTRHHHRPALQCELRGQRRENQNDNMASEKFFDFLFDAFSNMEKVMADDSSIYVFHADTEGLNFRKAFDAAGFYLRLLYLEEAVPGAGALSLPVATRAVPLWLEKERQTPVGGTPGAKSPPFGSSTSPRKTATIPP